MLFLRPITCIVIINKIFGAMLILFLAHGNIMGATADKFNFLINKIKNNNLPGWKINLREFPLTKEQIKIFSDTLTDNFMAVKNITHIDLSHADRGELPADIFKDCDGLISLNLDNTNLKTLPRLPDRPYALQDFFASDNPLKKIPAHYFDNCNSLKAVYLSNVEISEPPKFTDSLSLSWLHLDNNPISKFPEMYFKMLKRLDTLYIHNTRLKKLPDLRACKLLHEIWIDMIEVPDNIISPNAQIIVSKAMPKITFGR